MVFKIMSRSICIKSVKQFFSVFGFDFWVNTRACAELVYTACITLSFFRLHISPAQKHVMQRSLVTLGDTTNSSNDTINHKFNNLTISCKNDIF